MNRKQLWSCLFYLFALAFTSGCHNEQQLTYRVILPDGYVGWIRVDFGVDSAPEIFTSKKRQIVAEIRVGQDGRARTSDSMVIQAPKTNYEFFYDVAGRLQPVPDEFVNHDSEAGGISSRADDYTQTIKPLSWYFFVGPSSYRRQHPNSEYLSSDAALPLPGRLSP